MSTHTLRSAYSKKPRVQISFPDKGRTKQSFKAETDINQIMARFQKTGMLDFVNKHEPQYGDVTKIDFQTSMETVVKAREMFADLPSKVRDRFNNDPEEMLDFLDDPENRKEAVLLGLLQADKEPAPENTPDVKQAHLRPSEASETPKTDGENG